MINLSLLCTMRDRGHGLTIFCNDCGHFGPANMDALIERFGDFDAVDGRAQILASMQCGKCGSKNLDLSHRAPNQPRS